VVDLLPLPNLLSHLITGCADFSLLEGDIPYKIAFNEVDLRQKVLQAGGKWSRSTKTWKVPYKTVCKLGLEQRVIDKVS
jgi:hypothetical protein